MQRVLPGQPWPLFDAAGVRRLEQRAAAGLPPHTLMQRAGLSVARLALALAPHARQVWIACGPGNNGGDGLEAAVHLQAWGRQPWVTWLGDAARTPADAAASLRRAQESGVRIGTDAPPAWDFGIDALLGIGAGRPLEGPMALAADALRAHRARVLAVDLPSGLDADTGRAAAVSVRAAHTLTLLTAKPGLFTADGRDAAGSVWLDDLGAGPAPTEAPTAWLSAAPPQVQRPHASHKGSHGDVAVLGGAPGMAGAALLAGRAALHHGAGRVFVALLDAAAPPFDADQPDLMLRDPAALDLAGMAVACGCGGGHAVRAILPRVVSSARALVLDADGLNAVAADPQLQSLLGARGRRGGATVLTPHPLEAARLLQAPTQDVQADRLGAATRLAERYRCVVVLKGSGTVVAAPGQPPRINPTGNARLAIAGTGDVLAGWIAARLAAGDDAFEAAMAAVYLHGLAADAWPPDRPLTAAALARAG